MYSNRTKAAYTSPVPAPLRLASRETKKPSESTFQLTVADEDKTTFLEDSTDESINEVTTLLDAEASEKWRSQPVDEIGSGVRIWNANEQRTPSGRIEPRDNRKPTAGGRTAKRDSHHGIVHGNNINNQWHFPATAATPRHPPSGAEPTPEDPWGLESLVQRMDVLDDFFDITPADRRDFRAEVDAELDAQRARHEAAFARAAGQPATYGLDEAAMARERVRRAENQAAGDRIIGSLHETMVRIMGSSSPAGPATPPAAPAATTPGTPRRYTADKPNPPPLVTRQEQRREKVKASVRRSGSKGSGGSVAPPGPGWI
jgi:hypothetical protein